MLNENLDYDEEYIDSLVPEDTVALAKAASSSGSFLIDQFRSMVGKSKDKRQALESSCDVAYPTGSINFDFRNGTVIYVKNEAKGLDFKYYSLGITDGSLTTIVGRSGCGKTTWALQTAANIVRPFPNSYIMHEDIEGGITEPRKQQLMGFYGEEFKKKYISRNTGITNENFYERMRMLYDLKMLNYKDYEYDTGLYDSFGNRIFKLQPTVVLLDSIAMLMPEKFVDEEEISGQMAATATAKANNGLFKRIIPMLKSVNIIFIAINHVRKKVDINPFAKTKAQISYFKSDEYLPGGDMPVYLANVLLYFDDSKLNPEKTYGVDGSLVDIHLKKSRNSKGNQYCTMVFVQDQGFDNDLSTFILLKDNDKIKGAGAYQYIEGHPEYKFTQKKFKQMLLEVPEFADIVAECAFNVLSSALEERCKKKDSTEISSGVGGNIYGRVRQMVPTLN